MIDNPFFHRSPVKDQRYFFGRSMEGRRLLRALRRGQSVSVVGPRRIGKSSLLFHIKDAQVRAKHDLGDEYLIIYVDCEGAEDATCSDFFSQLSEVLVWQMNGSLGETERYPQLYHAVKFTGFRKAVSEATSRGLRLAFLFDEFETLAANSNLNAGFFVQLRELANSQNVAYVTVIQTELYRLSCASATVLSSPFFNVFAPMHLRLFQEHESLRFVIELSRAGGMEFSQRTVEFILCAAGYHPFFLQVVCGRVFDYQVTKPELVESDYRVLASQIREELDSHFHYYWDHLDVEEKRFLTAIAESGKHSMQENPLLCELERKCLITKIDDGCHCVSASFGDFVREQAKHAGVSFLSQTSYAVADQNLGVPRPAVSPERDSTLSTSSASEVSLVGRKLGRYYIEQRSVREVQLLSTLC